MSQLKKIDYRQLDKKTSPQTEQAQTATDSVETSEPKISFFSSLATKWSLMDKKLKIECFVFFIILLAVIVSLVFYFINKRPVYTPNESYGEPNTENIILLEEESIDL